jgi:TRAP-type C4-dicarboxylate transport system permease small subunit
MNVGGSIWIVLLMLMTVANVSGRSWFGCPILGVAEIGKLSLVMIVFLQLPYVFQRGRHIAADFLDQYLSPPKMALVKLITIYCSFVLFVLIAISSWPLAVMSIVQHEFEYASKFFVPVAPARVIVFTGSVFAAIQLVLDSLRYFPAAFPSIRWNFKE